MLEILDVFIDIFRVVSPTMIVQLDNFTLNNFNKIILTDFRFVPDHHLSILKIFKVKVVCQL